MKLTNVIIIIFIFQTNSFVYADIEKISQSERTTEKNNDKKISTEQEIKTKQPVEFIPTEKIQSDSSVSFPVDI